MTDLEILKKLEKRLNITFGNFEEWQILRKEIEDKRRTKSTKVDTSILGNQELEVEIKLQNKQLYKVGKGGRIIELYLNGLGLTNIPEEVFDLINLKRFDFVENKLKEIPLQLASLEKLEKIVIFGNEIEAIPKEIVFHKRLKSLNVSQNPITSIPIEVIESGRNSLTSIRNYLNSLNEGTKNLNEVKVIIVGDGGSGKTSLQKLLTNEAFDPYESQTHGIVSS